MRKTQLSMALLGGLACAFAACSDEEGTTSSSGGISSTSSSGAIGTSSSGGSTSSSSSSSGGSSSSSSGSVVSDAGVDSGRDAAVDAGPKCGTASCSGNGTCADTTGAIVCTCNPGYGGATCATCATGFQDNDNNKSCLAACATSTCGGKGTCSDTTGTATCTCDPGYTGTACDNCAAGYQDKDNNKVCMPACAANTCSSNGMCDDATGTATCACNAGYAGATCNTCAAGYQDNDANGSCALACATATCSGNGTCADTSGTAICTCTGNFAGANCGSCKPGFTGAACNTCAPGKFGPNCDYDQVYSLNVPVAADWNIPADIPYTVNNSGAAGAFTRIAYRMTLDNQVVWVEMDAFTSNKALTGIPIDWAFDQTLLTNLTVTSTAPAVANITVPTNGRLEFWPNCYATTGGNNGLYDHDDDTTGQNTDCYGSFQIHVGTNTILAFNRWSGGGNSDIGFGNQVGGSGHPDWTFAQNAANFTTRRIEVFVK